MKKISTVLIMLFSLTLAFSTTNLLDFARNDISLLTNDDYNVEISYEMGQLDVESITTRNGEYIVFKAENYELTHEVGQPQLPTSVKIIAVPLEAEINASVNVISQKNLNLKQNRINAKVFPAQAPVAKCADINSLPFTVNNQTYQKNQMYSPKNISVKEIGIFRNYRLIEVHYSPVAYNPQNGDLRVITQANVNISFTNANYVATQQLVENNYSPAFEGMLAKTIYNYRTQRDMTLDRAPMGYIIITDDQFEDGLADFVTWKKKQGYRVTLANKTTTGSTKENIKAYIQNIWDNATPENPAPSYLLIVGDNGNIPAWNGSTTTGNHITDLDYVKMEGNDYLPEMYFGRFSVTNNEQLENIVNKTLYYEQYQFEDPSYLDRVTLTAGVDSHWAPTHGNGAIYYATTNYYNEAHGLDVSTHTYPASGQAANQILQECNEGMSLINYTAHGSETTWHSPQMTIPNLNAMQNENKYFVAIGNCCLTNHFNTPTCFGEGMIRAENAAVVYIGGTDSTYWDEDYWWGVGYFTPTSTATPSYDGTGYGTYDATFHEHDEAYEDWITSVGSNIYVGNMAVQGHSNLSDYYWEIYSIMGDPSLRTWIGEPEAQNVTAQTTIFIGASEYEIQAAPYSYAALSMNGELLGTVITDQNGNGTISFDAITAAGNADLVISSNKRALYQASIEVIPAEGPFLVIDNVTNTGDVTAGSQVSLDFSLENVGVETTENITANVTCITNNASMNNDSFNCNPIAPDATASADAAITATINDGTAMDETITFHIVLTAGSESWEYNYNLQAIAPKITISSVEVSDDNNALDPGDDAQVTISFVNNGNYAANNNSISLVSASDLVTINNPNIDIDNLEIGANNTAVFNVSVSDACPEGTGIAFAATFTSAHGIHTNETFALPVGLIKEDFESGDFNSDFNWSTPGWSVVNSGAHEGTYCAKTNPTNDNGNSQMNIQMDDVSEGTISFFVKTSTEANYDELTFYIDNEAKNSWSGNTAWTQVEFDVPAGDHTFKWTYSRDYSYGSGSNSCWVDDIVFPCSVQDFPENPNVSIATLDYELPAIAYIENETNEQATTTTNLVIANNGSAAAQATITMEAPFFVKDGDNLVATKTIDLPANENTNVVLAFSIADDGQAHSFSQEVTVTTTDTEHPSFTLNLTGEVTITVDNQDNDIIPLVTSLAGNYPNPFNPETTIRFGLKNNSDVSLVVYNLKGQIVKNLVKGNVKAGYHNIVWNGKNNDGSRVSSGVYFYRLKASDYSSTKKMILMK